MTTAPITASTLARVTASGLTGAVITRSGASSPEMASQASAPPSWPPTVVSTMTTTTSAPVASPKLRMSSSAGGTR